MHYLRRTAILLLSALLLRRVFPDPPPTLFEDVSPLLGHQHHEELFDDFARQPLLPNRLSQLGPGVAWIDLNCDGRDNLVIGTGKGGVPGVFENSGSNTF